MTIDELMSKIRDILPEAIFDEDYRSGELMISTGLVARGDKLEEIVNDTFPY